MKDTKKNLGHGFIRPLIHYSLQFFFNLVKRYIGFLGTNKKKESLFKLKSLPS